MMLELVSDWCGRGGSGSEASNVLCTEGKLGHVPEIWLLLGAFDFLFPPHSHPRTFLVHQTPSQLLSTKPSTLYHCHNSKILYLPCPDHPGAMTWVIPELCIYVDCGDVHTFKPRMVGSYSYLCLSSLWHLCLDLAYVSHLKWISVSSGQNPYVLLGGSLKH